MTYNLCKRLIQAKRFKKQDMMFKLDVFLLNNRITQEQYEELLQLLEVE